MANLKKKKRPKIKNISEAEPAGVNTNAGAGQIVNAIITNSRNAALAITDSAKSNVEDNVNAELDKVREYCGRIISEAETASSELIRHRIMLAQMDVKKHTLKARQDVIDRAYAEAENGILSMPDNKYIGLIENIVKKYAENGDEIIISPADKKRLTADIIKKTAEKTGKKIKLSDEPGAFSGGIILRGKDYDKNFTISGIIREIRAQTEGEIAKILFS